MTNSMLLSLDIDANKFSNATANVPTATKQWVSTTSTATTAHAFVVTVPPTSTIATPSSNTATATTN